MAPIAFSHRHHSLLIVKVMLTPKILVFQKVNQAIIASGPRREIDWWRVSTENTHSVRLFANLLERLKKYGGGRLSFRQFDRPRNSRQNNGPDIRRCQLRN